MGVDMKYPDDIDKKSWDIMVEYTCYALTTVFILTVGIIIYMMIQSVFFYSYFFFS